MVLRPGQRRQAEELNDVERQLVLNDGNVTPDGFRRVRRKAEYVARQRDNPLILPRQQHRAVFGDLVLPLLGGGEVVGVDVLETDEDAGHPSPLRFGDEVWDLMTQRIDLNHQTERDPLLFAQPDKAVEDRLPPAVAGEVVVGDEELADALRPVATDKPLDIVGAAISRLAALDVDDRAERTLIRTSAPSVETGAQPESPSHVSLGEQRFWSALQVGQVIHEIVRWLQGAGSRISQNRLEPAFRFAGEHRHAQVAAGAECDSVAVQHRQAAGDVKAAD